MRFSELVLLGSTIIHLDPTIYLSEGYGCFIGMAAAAKTGVTSCEEEQYRVTALFPWMNHPKPNACPVCGAEYRDYCSTIGCLAAHVQEHQWTFEQALDFIRIIEPQEEDESEAKECMDKVKA